MRAYVPILAVLFSFALAGSGIADTTTEDYERFERDLQIRVERILSEIAAEAFDTQAAALKRIVEPGVRRAHPAHIAPDSTD